MPTATESTMPERLRALLFLNGFGLIVAAVVSGWAWFFNLLGEIVLWPIPGSIQVQIPGDARAWRMAHMEGITQGLLLMALGLGGQFLRLRARQHTVLFWCAVTTAWLFTLPTMLHPLFGTRGLAFGGGPFKPGIENDVLYLIGWPPVIAVHVMLFLTIVGVWRYLRGGEALGR
ncbi:MAG TPA: hypothetical protein VMS22_21605 [Candidatus Eisenbacteria bacterium]|nr:hypothetical protein [Candidatus Eisenbacteria bacterium]